MPWAGSSRHGQALSPSPSLGLVNPPADLNALGKLGECGEKSVHTFYGAKGPKALSMCCLARMEPGFGQKVARLLNH